MTIAPIMLSCRDRSFDLLDGASVRELLRAVLPETPRLREQLDDVRVERCWPIGKTDAMGFVFEWSFRAGTSRRFSVYGQLGGPRKHGHRGDSTCQARSQPLLTRDGVRGLAVEAGGLGGAGASLLSIRSPDCDPQLPQLSACLDPKRMAKHLAAFGMRTDAPLHNGRSSLRCRMGGYRPGRRAALRFGCGDGVGRGHLCGKTFRDDRGKFLLELHLKISEQLRRSCGGRVRVPAPVGFDDELRLAMFYWMPGISAATIVSTPEVVQDAAVEAICAVHDLPSEGRIEFSPHDEASIVVRWRDVLRIASPRVVDEAVELAERISTLGATVTTRHPVTVHRDFYEKQLMVSPEYITVLDLDTIARGDPCVDLGNFLAHQFLRGLARGERDAEAARRARTFIESYEGRRGGVDRGNLAFYAASTLFRLGAVHALRTATSRYRPALWRAAAHFLNRGAFDSFDIPSLADGWGSSETALREVG